MIRSLFGYSLSTGDLVISDEACHKFNQYICLNNLRQSGGKLQTISDSAHTLLRANLKWLDLQLTALLPVLDLIRTPGWYLLTPYIEFHLSNDIIWLNVGQELNVPEHRYENDRHGRSCDRGPTFSNHVLEKAAGCS